jgi:hypothetical protein
MIAQTGAPRRCKAPRTRTDQPSGLFQNHYSCCRDGRAVECGASAAPRRAGAHARAHSNRPTSLAPRGGDSKPAQLISRGSAPHSSCRSAAHARKQLITMSKTRRPTAQTVQCRLPSHRRAVAAELTITAWQVAGGSAPPQPQQQQQRSSRTTDEGCWRWWA